MEITRDDVPYQLHQLLDIIGYDNFLEVCKMYGGSAIYIPMYKSIMIGPRNKELIKDYDGKNIDMLRVKYGMSKEHIRKIIYESRLI
ncbi:MAG: Mor transcription activator family protein [Romboutsia sp.]